MFRRQIEIIGKENQEKLSKKSILIVGAGGLGNIIASTLSCIGLKKIYIIDFDKIEIHNIHRQFQFNKSDIGKFKAEVLAKRVSRCKELEYYVNEFNEKFADKFFSKNRVDLIIDATDNFEVRKEIDKASKTYNIPWIYSSVEEFRGQVGVFVKTSFDIFAIKNHKVKGQIPPVVNIVGSFASLIAFKFLLGERKERLFYLDLVNYEIKEFLL